MSPSTVFDVGKQVVGFKDEFAWYILGSLGNVRNFQEFLGIFKRPVSLGIVKIFQNLVESFGMSWRVLESSLNLL